MVEKLDLLAHCGLTLSTNVLRHLDKVGIFANQTGVSSTNIWRDDMWCEESNQAAR
jgi:hypothetical protein